MAFDPVPWFVGGGALHSPEVARNFAWQATSGAEGVGSPLGLRVASLATPGTSVRILPGSCLVLNRSVGGAEQTYAARAGTETVLPVAAQGASGTRYDLVVARVEDPFMAGTPWADPTDATVGPYVFPRVISNVPAGTTRLQDVAGYSGDSAITLARIAIPANTATITQAMITDLRTVARPKRQRDLYNTQPTTTTSVTSTSYVNFANASNRVVRIPSWASQVKIIGHIAGAVARNAALIGGVRILFGSNGLAETAVDMDVNTRQTLLTSDTFAIPANYRGTDITIALQAKRSSGTGTLQTDQYSTVVLDVEFLEIASAD